ncbi:MAG: hypothetical protein M3P96_11820 [Actinomycetota bacterium]|nr:hypothetical protein [Actinomycetota bacterium]
MPETVFGLPTHILSIHAVVVLVPLSAGGVVLMALIPPLRRLLRWPVLAVLTAALAAVPVATQSGELLMARLVREGALGGPVLDKVQLHQELGEQVLWPVLGLWIFTVALVAAEGSRRPARHPALLAVLTGLAVVAALLATLQVIRTGHAGATAVWNPGA